MTKSIFFEIFEFVYRDGSDANVDELAAIFDVFQILKKHDSSFAQHVSLVKDNVRTNYAQVEILNIFHTIYSIKLNIFFDVIQYCFPG